MRQMFIKIGLMCEFEDTKVGYQAAGLCLLMGILVFLFLSVSS